MQNFWTYSIDDNAYYDAEFETSEDAIKAMDEHYAMQFEGDDLESGDAKECDAEIICFRYNDYSEREILYTQPVIAEYKYYHGDNAEYGTYY